jgi:PAS domain S-box-containing protein
METFDKPKLIKGADTENKRLQLQIRFFLGDEETIPEKYEQLFRAINTTYNHFDKENDLLSDFVELDLDKIVELNNSLKKETVELRRVNNEVKTLFENINEVFFSVDLVHFRINQMSAACEKVYGYAPEEFYKNLDLWKEVIHPQDGHLVNSHDANLAKGKPVNYEYRIIHKDGSVKWVETKVIPTLNGNGEVIRIDGVVSDITGRKKDEEKIREAERIISEAQKIAKTGNWSANLQTFEISWSDGLRAIYGVDEEYTASLKNFLAIVHPEDLEYVRSTIAVMEENGGTLEQEYRIIRPCDREIRIIHSTLRSDKDENGNALISFGISQDITERVNAEYKVEELNMLMYQISHDLRGPLNSAKNYIYLALKRVQDETANKYLAKIHDSYSTLEHWMLSLLNLQRLNRNQLRMEKVDLKTLTEEVLTSLDSVKGSNHIDITTHITMPDTFYTDKQFLNSIIYNLVNNSIAHKRDVEDAFVNISAYTENDMVIIKVADNGKGIPVDMQDKIFNKFVKGNSSSTGTGLGLYIVKNLADKLQGTINFESVPMKGTTFTLRIPASI